MIEKLVFIAVLTGLTGIMSCNTEDISCQRVSTEIVTAQKSLAGFDGIIFSAVGDIKIAQGNDYSFTIKGPKNVVEALTTEIVGTDLLIGSSSCFNGFTDNNQLTLNITLPSVRSIELTGTGDISSVNTLTGDYLNVSLYGVGTVDVDMVVDSLHTEIPGTGTVKLTGVVQVHDVIHASSAKLSAFGLVADTTFIIHRGVGDIQLFVNDLLKVNLSGTGNIYYKGNPVIDKQITGTGQLIDAN